MGATSEDLRNRIRQATGGGGARSKAQTANEQVDATLRNRRTPPKPAAVLNERTRLGQAVDRGTAAVGRGVRAAPGAALRLATGPTALATGAALALNEQGPEARVSSGLQAQPESQFPLRQGIQNVGDAAIAGAREVSGGRLFPNRFLAQEERALAGGAVQTPGQTRISVGDDGVPNVIDDQLTPTPAAVQTDVTLRDRVATAPPAIQTQDTELTDLNTVPLAAGAQPVVNQPGEPSLTTSQAVAADDPQVLAQDEATGSTISGAPGAGDRIREAFPGVGPATPAGGGTVSTLSGRTAEEDAQVQRNVAQINRQGEALRDLRATRLGVDRGTLDRIEGRAGPQRKQQVLANGDILDSRFGRVRPEKLARLELRAAQAEQAQAGARNQDAQAAKASADAAGGGQLGLRDRIALANLNRGLASDQRAIANRQEDVARRGTLDERTRQETALGNRQDVIAGAAQNPITGEESIPRRQELDAFVERSAQQGDEDARLAVRASDIDAPLRRRAAASSGFLGTAGDFGDEGLGGVLTSILGGSESPLAARDVATQRARVFELVNSGTINGQKVDVDNLPDAAKQELQRLFKDFGFDQSDGTS